MDARDLRILVAEDEFTTRILMQEFMKTLGVVHTVVNGQEAIDATRMALRRRMPYHLICLDIMMPEVDGLAALAAIRALDHDPELPNVAPARIIMATSLRDVEKVKEAVASGCDGYLIKPVDRNVLLRQVAKLFLSSTVAKAAG